MSAGGIDGKTVISSTISPTDGSQGGPKIEHSEESEEYQQDLQVVLGTAFGVIIIVGVVVVAAVLYRVTRNRNRVIYGLSEDGLGNGQHLSVDIGVKSPPLVLILYSHDCPLHTQVVAGLAGLLTEACGVTVTFDLWEEAEVAEQGVESWLVERLQEADFILVVCSVGARLRCSKKKIHFKTDVTRLLPDYFAVAVDYVAEKLRAERLKGLGSAKFLTVYMEYSTPQDIPHQLEASTQFCLLRDIHLLIGHLSLHSLTDSTKSDSGSQTSLNRTYMDTEAGEILQATLEQAKIFFKENPSWMDDFIEQIEAPFWSLKRSKRKNKRRGERRVCEVGDRDGLSVSQSLLQSQDGDLQRNHYDETQVDLCSVLPLDNGTSHLLKCGQYCLGSPQGLKCRQNSLPSSLASSGGILLPGSHSHMTHAVSKSLDSVVQGPQTLDVPTCLFCGGIHTEGRPVCRTKRQRNSDDDLDRFSISASQKIPAVSQSRVSSSQSHTVLRAEVHQEWGTNSLDHQSQWKPKDYTKNPCQKEKVYEQMNQPNSHYSPTSLPYIRSQNLNPVSYKQVSHLDSSHPVKPIFCSLSQQSTYTDDSGSMSDSDSLERDLRSINHISSFKEFVNSTSFTLGQTYLKAQPDFGRDHITLNILTHSQEGKGDRIRCDV